MRRLGPLLVPLVVLGLVGCSSAAPVAAGDAGPGDTVDAATTAPDAASFDAAPGPADAAAPSDAHALPDASDAGSCIDDVSPGQHAYSCDGFVYDVAIPPACATPSACGLVVDVHGLTMDGLMEDDNTNMRALGAQYGYVVVQPNANPAPPQSSWNPPGDDDHVYAFLVAAIQKLAVDPRRVHMTGFSQGGMMTFRFLCNHADLFASVAPAAGDACSFQAGSTPSREIPVLYMHGTKDALVSFTNGAIPQRDAVVAGWQMGAGTVVDQGTGYVRTRYTNASGNVFEFLQHDYAATSPFLQGHCYPGSTDPGGKPGQLFPFACVAPNGFTWGAEVMKFFVAHE
jgi:polyhydroxybutyrate depolymerase